MKKKISYSLILALVIIMSFPAYGQDSIPNNTPKVSQWVTPDTFPAYGQDSIPNNSQQVIKEVVVKETKVKFVRDTIVKQADSTLFSAIHTINDRVADIEEKQVSILVHQKAVEDSNTVHWRVFKWFIAIELILILSIVLCLIQLILHTRQFFNGYVVTSNQTVPDTRIGGDNYSQQDTSLPEDTMRDKPTLDAYNTSVKEFTTINDHVADLRKKDTKPLVMAMYRYLSLQTNNKDEILSEIRSSNISEDAMEQFVALVYRIENFINQKKPIISAWLELEPKDGISNYELAVRMPEGLSFDKNLDEEVLGNDIEGQQISMVYKLGFYFPGNTINPYRVKSVVSA